MSTFRPYDREAYKKHLETCDCCYQKATGLSGEDMGIFELRKKVDELRENSKEITRKLEATDKRIETINQLLSFLKRDLPKEWR